MLLGAILEERMLPAGLFVPKSAVQSESLASQKGQNLGLIFGFSEGTEQATAGWL